MMLLIVVEIMIAIITLNAVQKLMFKSEIQNRELHSALIASDGNLLSQTSSQSEHSAQGQMSFVRIRNFQGNFLGNIYFLTNFRKKLPRQKKFLSRKKMQFAKT